MKKTILAVVLLGVLATSTACSSTNKTSEESKEPKTSEVSSKKEEKETNFEDVAKKDATTVLNAVLNDNTSGFKKLQGESYSDFLDKIAYDFMKENTGDYKPEADYTIPYDENTSFTPSEVLTNFRLTQAKVLQNIGEFTIKDVTADEDTAEITFESYGIATKDLANALTLIRSNVFEGGLGGSWLAQMTQNEEVTKANDLLNYYLYFLAFDKGQVDANTTDDKREFTLNLEKDGDNYVMTSDSFLDLAKELNVQEYSSK